MLSKKAPHRKTIKTDVLICGGGCAGTAAAMAIKGKSDTLSLSGNAVREKLESEGAGPRTDV